MVRRKAAGARLGFRGAGQQLGGSLWRGSDVSPPEWAAPPIRAKGQSRGKEARRKEVSRERPTIVTAIAALFLLSAVYLLIVGLTMLARPGFLSMAAGADLLNGLETAGPYIFLLVSAAEFWVGVGWFGFRKGGGGIGLLLPLMVLVFLFPRFSAALVAFAFWALAWGGLGFM